MVKGKNTGGKAQVKRKKILKIIYKHIKLSYIINKENHMAIKKYSVTISPEPYTVEVEASKPQGALNKAHREWRDTIAKNPEKLEITVDRVKADVTEAGNDVEEVEE